MNVTISNCELSRGAPRAEKGDYCHSYGHWVNIKLTDVEFDTMREWLYLGYTHL